MKTYKILFQVLGEKKAMYVQADSPQQAREILKNKVVKIDSIIDKTEPNVPDFVDFLFNAFNIKK